MKYLKDVRSAIGKVFLVLLVVSILTTGLVNAQRTVGVQVGDWAEYTVTGTFQGNMTESQDPFGARERSSEGGIYKFSVCYGGMFAYSDIRTFVAENFDLAIIDVAFDKIYEAKAINPNMKVISYTSPIGVHSTNPIWNEVNQHEDWFLHDLNGNRLIHIDHGWYLMDPTNVEWQSYFVNMIREKLRTFPDLDGVFTDECWDKFNPRFCTVPSEQIPDFNLNDKWHNDIKAFLNFIKSSISYKLLIANVGFGVGIDYAEFTDGLMWEGAYHPSWYPLTAWYDSYVQPTKRLEHVALWSKQFATAGKILLILDGCTSESDAQLLTQVQRYTLCAFLLGAEKTCVYGWNIISHPSKGYFPEMDIDLGRPIGSYYIENGIYKRTFEGGTVEVNFASHE